ncbi:MAG: MFS transporter [Chloroflexi bacterium]|nr:MFS transporter [Chloroflexota bacterium]
MTERSQNTKGILAKDGSALFWPVLLGSSAFGILSFLLPIYGRRLGASALEIGGLYSVFALMTVLIRPVVGWALDRFGRRTFFVAALVCYAVAMGLFSIADSVAGLYLARLMQGVASALMWISAYTIATDLASPEGRGGAVGRVDEASARGSLYGALAGFALLAWLPLSTGWRVLFLAYALLAAFGAWLAWKRVPETQPVHSPQTEGRRAISGLLFRLMVIVFVTGASTAMVSPLVLIFLQDKFTAEVGMLALAFIPAALVYSFLPSRLGQLSDRFGRTPLMAAGLVGSGIVSLLLPGLSHIGWLIVMWALEALGLTMAAPAQEALVADLTGSTVRGVGYGLYTFATSLGATLGPLLGGWLYDAAGPATPFYLNGIVLFAGAVWVLVLLGKGSLRAAKATVDSTGE